MLAAIPPVPRTLAGLPGAAGGIAIIAATTVYGVIVAVLGWQAREASRKTPRPYPGAPVVIPPAPYGRTDLS